MRKTLTARCVLERHPALLLSVVFLACACGSEPSNADSSQGDDSSQGEVCGDSKPVAQGVLKNTVADIDFTGEEVDIQLYHKLDIDEWEDGCIARYVINLSMKGLGCKLHLEMGSAEHGVLAVSGASFAADSFCPGWSDADEGEYLLDSSNLSLCSAAEVADHMTESACMVDAEVSFLGTLSLIRNSDGRKVEVDLSDLKLLGDVVSIGNTELACPQEPCADRECGKDACGRTCGECQDQDACVDGKCECEPNCFEKVCGNGGCEDMVDACGECGEGEDCEAGQCKQEDPERTEPGSDLTWQDPPAEEKLKWEEAKEYCSTLDLDGHDDWHLPTIGELRSLIRGCPATELDGSCNVEETNCLESSCRDASCDGCVPGDGPADGCYQPEGMLVPGDLAQLPFGCSWLWSATAVADTDNHVWSINFSSGNVYDMYGVNHRHPVRCVRN